MEILKIWRNQGGGTVWPVLSSRWRSGVLRNRNGEIQMPRMIEGLQDKILFSTLGKVSGILFFRLNDSRHRDSALLKRRMEILTLSELSSLSNNIIPAQKGKKVSLGVMASEANIFYSKFGKFLSSSMEFSTGMSEYSTRQDGNIFFHISCARRH